MLIQLFLIIGTIGLWLFIINKFYDYQLLRRDADQASRRFITFYLITVVPFISILYYIITY